MIRLLVTVFASLLLLWLMFMLVVFVTRPKGIDLRASMRVLPDTLRLIRRLAADPATPRNARVWLWLLLGYLLLPIDVVPDFIPVLGYADDAIIVALVLRHVVRRAGPDALQRLSRISRRTRGARPALQHRLPHHTAARQRATTR